MTEVLRTFLRAEVLRAQVLRALLPLLAIAASCPVAGAQERPINGHTFLPDGARLQANQAGQRFYVEGRWESCWGDQVSLYKEKGPAGFFFADPRVQPALAGDELPGSDPVVRLVSKKSRVRLFGRAERRGAAVVFVVESAQRLEDDVTRLQGAARQAEGDPDLLAALAREAATLSVRYDDADLRALGAQLTRRELEMRRAALPAAAFRDWLALADRYRALGDRTTAIALLSHVERNADDVGLRGQAQTGLSEVGAVRTREAWVTFERFKSDEGFIERKAADGSSRWVKRELAELEDVVAAEQALNADAIVVPRTNPVQHGANATAGKLERGQTMHEARLAGGPPVTVYHHRAPDAPGVSGRPALWSQWIFADGRRAYFLGRDGDEVSVLIAAKARSEAYPAR